MAKVIVFSNQKGGCGKSTLVSNVAAAAQARGINVAIYDADPEQASATDWCMLRTAAELPPIHSYMPSNGPLMDLSVLRGRHDLIVVDTPGSDADGMMRQAMRAADRIILPIEPAFFSTQRLDYMLEYLRDAPTAVRANILLNRVNPNPVLTRRWGEVMDDIEQDAQLMEYMPPLPIIVYQREVYVQSLSGGRAVIEVTPTGPAATEMNNLTTELMK